MSGSDAEMLCDRCAGRRVWWQPRAAEPAQPADLVVVNAKILTVDERFREVQALAVRGGRFVAVGSTSEVRARFGGATRVIDGRGRTVIPGLIDSHVHALGVAAAEASQPFRTCVRSESCRTGFEPGQHGCRRTPGYERRVYFRRACASAAFPTRQELDEAAPRHPVAVDSAYAFSLNTRAAGCGRDSRVSRSAWRRDRQGCARRADGSPSKRRAKANWLPAPDDQFALIIRVCVPTEPLLNGTYALPNAERK